MRNGPCAECDRLCDVCLFAGSGYRSANFFRYKRVEDQRRKAATLAKPSVGLLRSYRVGELPDIQQITRDSFLAPLMQASRMLQVTYAEQWHGCLL